MICALEQKEGQILFSDSEKLWPLQIGEGGETGEGGKGLKGAGLGSNCDFILLARGLSPDIIYPSICRRRISNVKMI